ncbi:hypothetical protein [Kineococcus indalonis]|uniref:hypothetical protein n=1 Tax=Kineococcus indalonis TaxID=2696566 RepID=UPI00196B0A59|nr:hypothetical protein [Kineococcus indalonis]
MHIDAPNKFRASTVQACGLWPFAAGAGTPMVGVPMGAHLQTGATVCCDPISWFQRARLIPQPTMFVLAKPGLGKSTAMRHMLTGQAGYGVLPLVLGDLKPDYVALIRALGGQVIEVGPGRGHINVLDPGEARAAAARLTGTAREAVLADAHDRRHQMMASLITISRAAPPTDREDTILDRALHVLDSRSSGTPLPQDLLQVIREAPEDVRLAALDRGDFKKYQELTENLEATLVGISSGTGRLGGIFAQHTTTPARRDLPLVYDLSSIGDGQTDLQGAALLACWSDGFGMVRTANALADAGLEPRRHYMIVMDELWRALRAGRGLVDRVDVLTRLPRTLGVGTAMITHTVGDLDALPEQDRKKAVGFIERSSIVMCGGLPEAEMPKLTPIVPLSQAEQDLLVGWTDPPAWDAGEELDEASTAKAAMGIGGGTDGGDELATADPPGMGKFLIKVGGRPGIPVEIALTSAEKAVNDTNSKWHVRSRIGEGAIDALIDEENLRTVRQADEAAVPLNAPGEVDEAEFGEDWTLPATPPEPQPATRPAVQQPSQVLPVPEVDLTAASVAADGDAQPDARLDAHPGAYLETQKELA